MPSPVPCRGIPAAHHQHRFSALDDEKRSPSSSCPAAPTFFDHTSSTARFSLPHNKQSGQDIHRIVKEAMATCAQSHCLDDFPCHEASKMEHHARSSERPSMANRSQLQEKLSKNITKRHSIKEKSVSTGDAGQVLCVEVAGRGTQWKYFAAKQGSGKNASSIFQVVDSKSNQNPFSDLAAFVRSCIVPEGYPESVSSSYKPYMHWRALKYFFGGAMSVFTTRSLLHALGVSKGAASSAVAANWVIKDGAGRIGKMLFARHGKKFDCDMKQLRFMGDLLMEFGAAVELATIAAPNFFLPLACAANVAKNVAAVTSTSTRASIYRAFARGENIGDVTAKGECISNIADLLGTGLGIFISKRNPSLMATFLVLSCGYLCCSYEEIKSVVLPTLNRARFRVAVQSFLNTGQVPSLFEGNQKEIIFTHPWARDKPTVLGARVNEAFESPHKFLDLLSLFQKENYIVTYNAKRRRTYVVLKEKANSEDVLKATFHAQVVASILQRPLSWNTNSSGVQIKGTDPLSELKRNSKSDIGEEAAIRESFNHVNELFEAFKHQTKSQGWILGESYLNPGIARLCAWKAV
eukprot:c17225_g1_i1 orf=666-2402(+)